MDLVSESYREGWCVVSTEARADMGTVGGVPLTASPKPLTLGLGVGGLKEKIKIIICNLMICGNIIMIYWLTSSKNEYK